MSTPDAAHTRNFALVGHAGDGKTSLAEALLCAAGAIEKPGSVSDGSSHLDTSPEERERKSTLASSVFAFAWNEMHLTLVDTPGDPNFQPDAQIALHALDGAVLVLSATEGARVGSEAMWRACERAGVPLLAFVNGLDKERADLQAATQSLAALGAAPICAALPIGAGDSLSGVVDLVAMQAWRGNAPEAIPADIREEAAQARSALVEAVAESDDALLEKYLEQGELDDAEVERGLVAGVCARKLVPVLCGAALPQVGTAAALSAMARLLPSPVARGPWPADGEAEAPAPDPKACLEFPFPRACSPTPFRPVPRAMRTSCSRRWGVWSRRIPRCNWAARRARASFCSRAWASCTFGSACRSCGAFTMCRWS